MTGRCEGEGTTLTGVLESTCGVRPGVTDGNGPFPSDVAGVDGGPAQAMSTRLSSMDGTRLKGSCMRHCRLIG